MTEGTHPETWHRLFRRAEKQAAARAELGLGSAAVEDAAVPGGLIYLHENLAPRFDFLFDLGFS